jgi:DNA (cytosine-5)-methyltransferase 1
LFDWNWKLSDIKQDKPITVFSTFSCGGGSSMGYKRAGFQVLGNVEIDPKINSMYVKNNHPKYNFCMDLRDFNKKEDLPDELYHLDILDGSPPCTVFSTAGQREKTWGKEKKFREGQKKQRLDDLFFVWLDTVAKLKPKIAIAENVTGLLKGNAKCYVNEIIHGFHDIGYSVQIFKLNAAFMDVPQARERVFFIANNQGYPKLKLDFHNEPIPFGKVRTAHGKPLDKNSWLTKERLEHMRPTDKDMSDILKRIAGKDTCWNSKFYQDKSIAQTLTAAGCFYRGYDKEGISTGDMINVSSFPQDYDFAGNEVQFVCGMSVPPNMMANIAAQIWEQWLK